MPVFDTIDGVVISVFSRDHLPPHCHAQYAEFEALVDIRTGDVIAGRLPARQLRKVLLYLEVGTNRQDLLEAFYQLNPHIQRRYLMAHKHKQPLPRITGIQAVEPFQITTLWTTGEVRQINFEPLFAQWKQDNDTRLYPLFDFDTFRQVSVSPTHTLAWPDVPVYLTLGNRTTEGPLDLDPDELYRQSTLVRTTERLPIGSLLRQARQDAGLSQLDVATRSGTSRHYISRIENGKSDIQLETLYKIVQLGIGKQLRLDIA